MRHELRTVITAYTFLAVAASAWAGNMVIARAMHAEFPPIAMAYWRWTGALLVLLPFTWRDLLRNRETVRREWRLIAMLAATGMGLFHIVQYTALNLTGATNVALMLALCPAVIPLFAWMILGERINRRQGAGIAVSLGGAVVLVTRGSWQALAALDFAAGEIVAFLGMLLWSVYSVFAKHRPERLGGFTMLTAIILFASPMILPFYLWESFVLRTPALTWQAVGTILYMSVLASLAAYLLFNRAVEMIGPVRAGPSQHLIPAFAMVFAMVLLDERLAPYHFAGLALIVTGIVLVAAPVARR
jgi:drug/metabolite transporter (DMT)-like permease